MLKAIERRREDEPLSHRRIQELERAIGSPGWRQERALDPRRDPALEEWVRQNVEADQEATV
ncbi:MAG: hypothetical protein Q7S29_06540 [Candidatus Peribacter sp.]|nr:hypothetical protein [Candidatus Peribacter sp.]